VVGAAEMWSDIAINAAVLLKIASVFFGFLAVWPAMRARSLVDASVEDPDRGRRRLYLTSYFLTTISILLFSAISLV
jgi:hypothetical protein